MMNRKCAKCRGIKSDSFLHNILGLSSDQCTCTPKTASNVSPLETIPILGPPTIQLPKDSQPLITISSPLINNLRNTPLASPVGINRLTVDIESDGNESVLGFPVSEAISPGTARQFENDGSVLGFSQSYSPASDIGLVDLDLNNKPPKISSLAIDTSADVIGMPTTPMMSPF